MKSHAKTNEHDSFTLIDHLTIRFDEETLTVSENDGNVQILLTLVQEIVVTVTVGFVFTGTASEGQGLSHTCI